MSYEKEQKAGRIVGTILADLLYYSCVLGVGVLSVKILSKIIKTAITLEIMRGVRKNEETDSHDIPLDDNYYSSDANYDE